MKVNEAMFIAAKFLDGGSFETDDEMDELDEAIATLMDFVQANYEGDVWGPNEN